MQKLSKLSKLINDVPPISAHNFPSYNNVPLCEKIAVIPIPHFNHTFSRDYLGNELWVKFDEYLDFDPYLTEYKFNYNQLHDKNLSNFFKNPLNKEYVVKDHEIDANNDRVYCTLKDFNSFRKYLYQVWLHRAKATIKDKVRIMLIFNIHVDNSL